MWPWPLTPDWPRACRWLACGGGSWRRGPDRGGAGRYRCSSSPWTLWGYFPSPPGTEHTEHTHTCNIQDSGSTWHWTHRAQTCLDRFLEGWQAFTNTSLVFGHENVITSGGCVYFSWDMHIMTHCEVEGVWPGLGRLTAHSEGGRLLILPLERGLGLEIPSNKVHSHPLILSSHPFSRTKTKCISTWVIIEWLIICLHNMSDNTVTYHMST